MKWFCSYSDQGIWWFRLFGYGVRWKRISEHPLMFSERVLHKGIRICNWHFAWLKNDFPT